MVDAVLGVHLQEEGADDVKRKLLETRAAILGVSTAKLEEAKNTQALARDARNLNNENRLATQIWLAQHPAINNLSRAMSVYGNVSRTALQITSAFSLASLAFSNTNSSLLDLQGQLAQAERDQSLALKTYGYDSTQYADASEKVGVLKQKIKELNDQSFQGAVTGALNLAASIGLIGASLLGVIPEIAVAIPEFFAMSFAIGGITITAAPLIFALIAIAAAIILLITYWPQITAAIGEFVKILQGAWQWITGVFAAHWREIIIGLLGPVGLLVVGIVDNWDAIVKAFTDAFNLIKGGFIVFWNALITVANGAIGFITSGIESLANGFIAVINGMIRAINALAAALHLPQLGTIGNISIPKVSIPLVAAASGFEGLVDRPTMFLAGEAGAENVSISPTSRRSAGSTGVIINITVNGSIQSENDFFRKVDDSLRRSLKRSGFQI